jgi:glucose/arabinose dehydrogenase
MRNRNIENNNNNNFRKDKIIIVKTWQILFGIIFFTIFSLSVLSSSMPNSIEAQKAESEIEEEKQEGQHPIIKDPNLQAELLVEGLSWPTSMTFIDNNNILVLEKEKGTVRLVSNDILQEEPVLEVDVNTKAERGLLGIAMMNKDIIFLYYRIFRRR